MGALRNDIGAYGGPGVTMSPDFLHFTGLAEGSTSLIPQSIKLHQNYPNPFNPITTISYQLPNAMNVSISIYNPVGQLVETLIDENKKAGSHSVNWNGNNVSSGLYFYYIEAGKFKETKKMLLLK